MLLLCFSLSIYLLLPAPSQYELSWRFPHTTKECGKAELCKGWVLYWKNKKKGGTFNHFHINPKSRVQHENDFFFFFSRGYLDLLLPNSKVLAWFQKFELMVMRSSWMAVCVLTVLSYTTRTSQKSLSLVNLLPVSWSVGTFRRPIFQWLEKQDKNIAFCKKLYLQSRWVF